MKKVDKKIVLELLKNKHVVAVDNELKPRIRKGKEIPEEECIRVYVKQKLPVHVLTAEEIIPQKIDDIPTDIIDAGGEIVALKKPLILEVQEIDPTKRIRPLTAGVSIGNVAITAGTLGWFYQDKNGVKYLGSNAHVFTDGDPFKKPEEVVKKDIVQPGTYDGGKSPDDLVGHYVWHQQIQPDTTNTFNNMDFAVSTIEVDCDFKIWQQYSPTKLVGHLFAGSNEVTVVFKGKYIANAGYSPLNAQFVEVNVGDWVEKWGRTSGHKTGQVQSTNAAVKVNYGNNRYALFDDQIITDNISAGGDSGSSVWLTNPPPAPPPSKFMQFTKYAIKLFGFQIGTIEEVP